MTTREENATLGLGGLYRFIKDERYRQLLKWELEVIRDHQDQGIELELTDVRDLQHVDSALAI